MRELKSQSLLTGPLELFYFPSILMRPPELIWRAANLMRKVFRVIRLPCSTAMLQQVREFVSEILMTLQH